MTIVHTVRSRSLSVTGRLDAAFYTSPGVRARDHLLLLETDGVAVPQLGEIAHVWQPARFKREWAAPGEEAVPYLRPYDVFETVPVPAGSLSIGRSDNLDDLRVKEGTILQTCSGRNLGPSVVVDGELTRFALSHDLVRIEIADELRRLYVHAFMLTSFGQALLRQGKSGSVIDHLTADHVAELPVPVLGDGTYERVASQMRDAVRRFVGGRRSLGDAHRAIEMQFPRARRQLPTRFGWTISSALLGPARLDAAFHEPAVAAAKQALLSADSVPMSELADVWLPLRYKRYYVDPPNGRPILSGRQILQYRPINLRHVSDRSFDDPGAMEVRGGMTLFGGVGRAEGRIGAGGLVGVRRDGWLASNDVMRLTPRNGVRPGAVYLGLAAPAVQQQIEALPYGSVVDHIYPLDIERVTVPMIADDLATMAEDGAQEIESAVESIDRAVADLENALGGGH